MDRDWRFLKSPFWVFSQVFVACAIGAFLVASLWQFSRLQERQAENAETIKALDSEPVDLEVLTEPDLPEFTRVAGALEVIDDDFIRIGGRTYEGSTGTHVVMLATDPEGNFVFVNRGFWPQGDANPSPIGRNITVQGYVRNSIEQEFFGVPDVLDTEIAPRFDLEALQSRRTAPVGNYLEYWIQASAINDDSELSVGSPALLSEPELSEGSHLSYALQWLIFAGLTIVVYTILIRRRASSAVSSSRT